MIEIQNLVKRYGKNYAVNDVSFDVNKGEIVGFLGPNGAGKTTTMNILTGFLSATSGKVKIAGIDVLENPIEAKKRIGFLPEHPPLYLDMTVKEYLGFVYDLKKCRLNKKRHIEEIVDVIHINEVYNRPISHLSKGFRQRVGIAQALINAPDILIFDEPTVGLDPRQIVEIRSLISSLGKNHTVILSTHILPEVTAVCDRVVIINKGKLVANSKTSELEAVTGMRKMMVKLCGPDNEILSSLRSINGIMNAELLPAKDADSHAFLVESDCGIDVRKPIFNLASSKGWAMIGLESMSANLEDVFIAILDKSKKEENK